MRVIVADGPCSFISGVASEPPGFSPNKAAPRSLCPVTKRALLLVRSYYICSVARLHRLAGTMGESNSLALITLDTSAIVKVALLVVTSREGCVTLIGATQVITSPERKRASDSRH